jgi:hypothetical protein
VIVLVMAKTLLRIGLSCIVTTVVGLTYLTVPLLDYATETKAMEYQLFVSEGVMPSETGCRRDTSPEAQPACLTAAYMRESLDELLVQIGFLARALFLLGISTILGALALHGKALQLERAEQLYV